MTKQEMIDYCKRYAAAGSVAAISILEDFRCYPQNMQTKERLCWLIINGVQDMCNEMVIDVLDRKFLSKSIYGVCIDYLSLDGRVKHGKK